MKVIVGLNFTMWPVTQLQMDDNVASTKIIHCSFKFLLLQFSNLLLLNNQISRTDLFANKLFEE